MIYKYFFILAMLACAQSSVAADSVASGKRSMGHQSSGGGVVDLSNVKNLFENIKGKETDVALSRTRVPYGKVRISDDGLFARVYDTNGNLLRTLSCFNHCTSSGNSATIEYKNAGSLGETDRIRYPEENINYVLVTNAFVKIGYAANLYYAYWRD